MKIEQTKGTFRLNGKTNVEKLTTKDLGWMKNSRLSVKSLKDNFVGVTFQERNGKGLEVSIKTKTDEKSHKVPFSNVVEEVKNTFINDDMLFVVGVTDFDTYRKEFVLRPTGVFHSDSDYDDENFTETNFVKQEFIFESFNGKVAKMYLVSFYGEVTEVELAVDKELVEDFESFKTGDFLRVVFSVVNKPIYTESETGDGGNGYTPKGKGVSSNQNSNKRKVTGYETYNIVVGIEDVVKGKFTRKDIRDAMEEYEKQQEAYQNNGANNVPAEDSSDDLPY